MIALSVTYFYSRYVPCDKGRLLWDTECNSLLDKTLHWMNQIISKAEIVQDGFRYNHNQIIHAVMQSSPWPNIARTTLYHRLFRWNCKFSILKKDRPKEVNGTKGTVLLIQANKHLTIALLTTVLELHNNGIIYKQLAASDMKKKITIHRTFAWFYQIKEIYSLLMLYFKIFYQKHSISQSLMKIT